MADRTCDFSGCGRKVLARSLCAGHYRQWWKGKPLTEIVRFVPSPSYGTVHKRLAWVRGSASLLACTDCGGAADEWSYNHSGIEETVGDAGNGREVPYSTDIDQYDPRCRPCHYRFDRNTGAAKRSCASI